MQRADIQRKIDKTIMHTINILSAFLIVQPHLHFL